MNFVTYDRILDPDWLNRPSIEVAPDLIGTTLVRSFPDGQIIRSLIVETEAYGPDDPGCHAYKRQTTRNSIMFGPAGYIYVYLIYGKYHCLNIVTDREGVASAVLIRALVLESLPSWTKPQQMLKPNRIAAGPGKLCEILQIDRTFNGQLLQPGNPLWLEDRRPPVLDLVQTTRIGLSQGADLPWRWYLKNCTSVSRL